jgi:hypothetical protein
VRQPTETGALATRCKQSQTIVPVSAQNLRSVLARVLAQSLAVRFEVNLKWLKATCTNSLIAV